MTLYALKPRFQGALRPFVRWLADSGVTANQVTISAAAGSIAVGAILALAGAGWPALFLLLPVWLLVRMALNAIDGMLAQEHGQASRLGAYLNEIGDVVSDTALYWPFALVQPFGAFAVGLVVLLAALSEFAGVMTPMAGGTRRYEGPFGKSDRAFAFGALGLWIGTAERLPQWAAWLMPVMAALLVLTIANRIRAGLAEAEAKTQRRA